MTYRSELEIIWLSNSSMATSCHESDDSCSDKLFIYTFAIFCISKSRHFTVWTQRMSNYSVQTRTKQRNTSLVLLPIVVDLDLNTTIRLFYWFSATRTFKLDKTWSLHLNFDFWDKPCSYSFENFRPWVIQTKVSFSAFLMYESKWLLKSICTTIFKK